MCSCSCLCHRNIVFFLLKQDIFVVCPAGGATQLSPVDMDDILPPMPGLAKALPLNACDPNDWKEELEANKKKPKADEKGLNTKPWPKFCGKNQNKDRYGYGDTRWQWAPAAHRRQRVPDPDNPGAQIQVPGYEAMCICDNRHCIRFKGSKMDGIDRGMFAKQWDDPAAMEACKLSTNYCPECYHKEWERCKVKQGCHNGRHAKGKAPPHQAQPKRMPKHVLEATPASQIDHGEFVDLDDDELPPFDEVPPLKKMKEKEEKAKKADELLAEPMAIASDGIVYADASAVVPDSIAEEYEWNTMAEDADSTIPKWYGRPTRRDPDVQEREEAMKKEKAEKAAAKAAAKAEKAAAKATAKATARVKTKVKKAMMQTKEEVSADGIDWRMSPMSPLSSISDGDGSGSEDAYPLL